MKKFLYSILTVFFLNSCTTVLTDKSYKASDFNSQSLGYHHTISLVSMIQKGNQAKLNDSLSSISRNILDSIIINAEKPDISQIYSLTDEKINHRLENDILKTLSNVRAKRKLSDVRTTPLMDSIVISENKRFALCVVSTGFARRKGNYGNQVAKGIGVGILTLGMYAPVPIKSNTSLYAMIYDAQKQSIVYFNYIPIIERSPVDKNNLNALYNQLFRSFYKN